MHDVGNAIVVIITSVIGLAIVAVLVSGNAQTPTVLEASGTSLAEVIAAAVSPVSGAGNSSLSNLFGSSGLSAGVGIGGLSGGLPGLTTGLISGVGIGIPGITEGL